MSFNRIFLGKKWLKDFFQFFIPKILKNYDFLKFSLFSKFCQKSSIWRISSSNGNLERWESEEFFTKGIIEKAFKIAEIWFFENYAFFQFLHFLKNKENIEKSIIFKKSYLHDFKSFFNNFFCKKSLRFPSFNCRRSKKSVLYPIFGKVLKIRKNGHFGYKLQMAISRIKRVIFQ